VASRFVIVGNSGSGKSTLAKRLAAALGLAHLDLDTIAWASASPPVRHPVAASAVPMAAFMDAHDGWIIEGCYGDLAEVALARAPRLLFLNPGAEACVAHARLRPWEPHKYASREAQDASLTMLIDWIRAYGARDDDQSLRAHRALFDAYAGAKDELTTPEAIAGFEFASPPHGAARPS
jgi:adenylate kinase family enzyme